MSALASSYVFSGERDASPWDTIQRLADEVGWTLTEPALGLIRATPATPVSSASQGRLMASGGTPAESRAECTRAEYMARICREAGLSFKGPDDV